MLTIRSTRVLPGPNLWAPVPVIVLEVTIGELEERLERETPVFFERLVALLPSLETHRATVGRLERGFARLLLEQIALAVQQQAGAAIAVAQTHPTAVPGRYRVVYAYQHEEVGKAAGTLAVRLLNHLLYGSERPSPSPMNWKKRSSGRPNATRPARSSTRSWRQPSAVAFRF